LRLVTEILIATRSRSIHRRGCGRFELGDLKTSFGVTLVRSFARKLIATSDEEVDDPVALVHILCGNHSGDDSHVF